MIEEDKPDKEQGYYLYPEFYGQPAQKRTICCFLKSWKHLQGWSRENSYSRDGR